MRLDAAATIGRPRRLRNRADHINPWTLAPVARPYGALAAWAMRPVLGVAGAPDDHHADTPGATRASANPAEQPHLHRDTLQYGCAGSRSAWPDLATPVNG